MANIPEKLLCHSAFTRRLLSENVWGERIFSENIEISKVRFEFVDKISDTSSGKNSKLAGFMFFDAYNSYPQNYYFKLGDIVIYDNNNYKVSAIKPVFGSNSISHFEIGLSNWIMRQI